MNTTLEAYIPFILPPLLGALIGYVTNYIAIRMLFRPLRPWYIFGIRIPMTPGIIPSRRGDLARKMGQMVGEHLLTSDDVGHTLDKPEFRAQLYFTLAQKLDSFTQRPLGAPVTLVPKRLRRRFNSMVEHVTGRLSSKVGRVVQSAVFARRIEEFTTQAAARILECELREVVDEKSYARMRANVADALQEWLQNPETREGIEGWLETQLDSLLSSDTSLGDLLPDEVQTLMLDKIQRQIPTWGDELICAMRSGENRVELEQMARDGIDQLIDSVEGLSALVGALFDMNIIYARVPEFIDKALDALQEWLHTDRARKAIRDVVQTRLEDLLRRPASEWVAGLSYAEVSTFKRHVSSGVYAWLSSESMRERSMEVLDTAFKRYAHHTLGELSAPALGDGNAMRAQQLGSRLSSYILSFLRSESFSRTSTAWLERQAGYLVHERPLGTLGEYLPSDAREELYQGLMRQFILLLKKELPPLVESMNVSRIVEDKVNKLDILEVEGLLMGIMREQFRYINLFGALLGFIIGLLNLGLLYL